jgi:Zn-dependent M28 family amino/carboxypeptidase
MFLLAAVPLLAQKRSVEFTKLEPPVIQERLAMVTAKMPQRRAALEKLFQDAGCTGENLTTQKVPGSKHPNLICTLAGMDAEAGVIVTGGHWDFADEGTGAIDDWSGSVLLPSLYQSLKDVPRRHSYVFVAFAAEETGLHGSLEYVNKLTREQRTSIRAMINLECLGLDSPKVWASRADRTLLQAYAGVLSALQIPVGVVNVGAGLDDDTHSFYDAKIPTLSIHSVTQKTLPLLHSSKDKLSAIHADDYYTAYQTVATLLAYLDGQ